MSQSSEPRQDISLLFAGHARHSKAMTLVIPDLKHYLVRIQLEGSGHAWLNGGYQELKPGDLLMLAPGGYYDLKIGYRNPDVSDPLRKVHSLDYYMILNGPWVDQWWAKQERPGKSAIGIDDHLLSLWREIMQEQRLFGSIKVNDIVKHLTFAFFGILGRTLTERTHPSFLNMNRTAQLAHSIKQYVEVHATEPFSLQDAADSVQLSVSRASHVFKETFQQSIMDYAIQVRITLACERILHGYMPLEQIAEMCGFQSYTYFYRTFKNRMGLSPRQFRDQRQLSTES
ncbi:AraC family transcriptional regulator [Paenibacillus thiaminolyticus]|uniref:AraC family transcriptional regulator n=1 Tax=Paenibacillus thiaminolyticus TaxID=49283 RepID=UPI00232F7427|nr:AraC family transcriptional regulator [Paenibacillus thiaminolyticus]WCF09671.1 AraC family transcriptional regulator [Paenibacillus thiaminolyticus]